MAPSIDAVPNYPAGPGKRKLAAGWLIEKAGFSKGHQHGGVGISTRHALALINRGNGTTRELLELAALIRSAVEKTFDITLEIEPTIVGQL